MVCRFVIPNGVEREIRCGVSPNASDGGDLAGIAATGANTVLVAEIGFVWSNYEYLARTRYTLDVAHRLGLKVVLQLHSRLLQSDVMWHPKSCYATWPSDGNETCNPDDAHASCSQNRAALQDWVLALREHPALLAWELGDEDTNHEVISQSTSPGEGPQAVRDNCDSVMSGEMQSAAAFIHELDPNRQLWQVVSDRSDDQQTANYMVGTDVFSHDPYYWLDTEKHTQAWSAAHTIGMFARNADWASRSYGFSPGGYAGNVNIAQGWAGYIEDCSELNRFPDATEFRWSVFAGLASGAKRGTLAWDFRPERYCTPSGEDAFERNPVCVPCAGQDQATCNARFNYGCSWNGSSCLDRGAGETSCAAWTGFRDDIVPPVFRDLRRLTHALESGWNVAPVTIAGNAEVTNPYTAAPTYLQVSSLLVYDDAARRYFLILTNNTTLARQVTAEFSTAGLAARLLPQQASVLGTTALVTFTAYSPDRLSMTDWLGPLGVRIYELAAQPVVGIVDGRIYGAGAWTPSGAARVAALSRTADSSGSLQLWTSGGQYWNEGSSPGRWTQTFDVEPNATNVLRFYARTGGWQGWYSYFVRSEDGTLLTSGLDINVYGAWDARDIAFSPGESRKITITLTNASYDWVLFDDFVLLPAAANGKIDTTRGWTASGTNVYWWPDVSRTNDGSGTLVLWGGSKGAGSGKWKHCAGVLPGYAYAWTWYARAGGPDRAFTYHITDGATGALLYQSDHIWAGSTWAMHTRTFNPGASNQVCLELSSLSYDWVAFDDFALLPSTLQNGAVLGSAGWTKGGYHAQFLEWIMPLLTDWASWFRNAGNVNERTGVIRLFGGGYDPTRYAGSWGRLTGTASQCFAVTPNTALTWRFWSRGVVNDMYFHYRVRTPEGAPLDDMHAAEAAPVRVDSSWQEFTVPFNTGGNSSVCIDLGARSWDYVMFDDLSVTP